ncbi:hypothetical protein [Methanosphaera sp. BMS]|uniref:hypothetical protein n=1 Tax=Methanosphaera sp. BMS TaxID=1789762 RepID=UPI000DC1ED2C|nr:hypothetical protein [Methanosphaera sp. BMS]AWX33174.1 hypothetical protein AW729_08780 [Methanosphaera sp. BMS]
MIKSKYRVMFVIFAVVVSFAIQSISATSLDSNDYSIDENCQDSNANHDLGMDNNTEKYNNLNDNAFSTTGNQAVNVKKDTYLMWWQHITCHILITHWNLIATVMK